MNARFEKEQALLDAYNAEMGLALSLHQRRWALTTLVKLEMGVTPEDVVAVLRELRRLHQRDPRRWPEASLQFRNAIANTGKFEEMAMDLRKRRPVAKRGAVKKAVATTEAPAAAPDELGRTMAQQLRAFRERGLE